MSDENKKTISFDPQLFHLSGTKKTRKNRDVSAPKVNIPKPIISASSIKQKLLNRVKKYKNEENKKTNIINKKYVNRNNNENYGNNDDDINDDIDDDINGTDDEDEFSNAMNYFEQMTNKKKEKNNLLNRTLKNKDLINNLNIPYQLQQHIQPTQQHPHPQTQTQYLQTHQHPQTPMQKQSNIGLIVDDVLSDLELPYGCLKNGNKPTYKSWKNSIKNYSDMSVSDTIRPPTPPKNNAVAYDNSNTNVNIKNMSDRELFFNEDDNHKEYILKKQIDDKLKKIQTDQLKQLFQDENLDDLEQDKIENVSDKKYVKKITKRKYTLGKSTKYKKIGVLIKGRQTKKNIIDSHKKIKLTDINSIKKHLKKHGLLKTGSSCPDVVLRKMYESALLSGDVTNTNKDTLIHNFLNEVE